MALKPSVSPSGKLPARRRPSSNIIAHPFTPGSWQTSLTTALGVDFVLGHEQGLQNALPRAGAGRTARGANFLFLDDRNGRQSVVEAGADTGSSAAVGVSATRAAADVDRRWGG